MSNFKCIFCGSDMVESGLDYDDGKIHCKCQECGETFTDVHISFCDECGKQLLKDEAIVYDGMQFCSEECLENYKKNN